MADEEAAGLGKTPGALGKRESLVTISDGSTVVVHKWSIQKFKELLPLVGSLAGFDVIAEQSVSEADRERIRALDPEDKLLLSTAATDLNVTPAVLGNLQALLDQNEGLMGALKKKNPPSSPK